MKPMKPDRRDLQIADAQHEKMMLDLCGGDLVLLRKIRGLGMRSKDAAISALVRKKERGTKGSVQ